MEIVPIPAFRDNYIWLLREGNGAAAVDPGDAAPIIDYLNRERLQLCAILVTHHHADHVGGVEELLDHRSVEVYGPAGEDIPSITSALREGDRVTLGLGAQFTVLEVPGHTRGHIAYYGPNILFCGDTLFACGCGRLFEGTPAQMLASLSKLASLPPNTRVYCAHEYTQSNCRFALEVEPGNPALRERAEDVTRLRAADHPTLPSSIELECATNPFLRSHLPGVRAAAERYRGTRLHGDVEVFGAIRKWKDAF